jgi:excisionase family DNA binding protein
MPNEDPLIPLERFRADVEAHPVTMRRWVHRGDLPATKLGGAWYVRRSDWEAFIERGMKVVAS